MNYYCKLKFQKLASVEKRSAQNQPLKPLTPANELSISLKCPIQLYEKRVPENSVHYFTQESFLEVLI